ncbi:hypothetical protein [Citrobacter braakii]|uniref:hypothetical protein n=1 Tax=Citrobacter braakii TaxID=57706 RepID=UPI0023B3304B|nr:hypothetical protein [Citrobacter braakii]MDE9586055.1 hypothetical protein [Citrobacter braakii]
MSEDLGGIYYTVNAQTAPLLIAQKEVDSANKKMQSGFDKTDNSVKKVSASFGKLSAVASAVATALSANVVVEYENAWTELSNKLVNAVKANETLDEVTNRVFKASQDMGRKAMQSQKNDHFVQSIRTEVDRYIQERQPEAPQPMQAIIAVLEESLPGDDLKFVAENITVQPDLLRSQDGKDLLGMLVRGLRKRGGSGTNTSPAANAGNTT